jgi:GNAT superfamily N-acetyltransferase
MIRICRAEDLDDICSIINEAAKAYSGSIPADCYHEPYMPLEELRKEMRRIIFFGWQIKDKLVGIMGLELSKDVSLIRHAYVLPQHQSKGIGSKLLRNIMGRSATPHILVGTWADAHWAIEFYQKHGFDLLPNKDQLLKKYWDISPRQIETSVVLGIGMNSQTRGIP